MLDSSVPKFEYTARQDVLYEVPRGSTESTRPCSQRNSRHRRPEGIIFIYYTRERVPCSESEVGNLDVRIFYTAREQEPMSRINKLIIQFFQA